MSRVCLVFGQGCPTLPRVGQQADGADGEEDESGSLRDASYKTAITRLNTLIVLACAGTAEASRAAANKSRTIVFSSMIRRKHISPKPFVSASMVLLVVKLSPYAAATRGPAGRWRRRRAVSAFPVQARAKWLTPSPGLQPSRDRR